MSEQKLENVNSAADAQSLLNVRLGWQPIETAPRNGTTILLRGKKAIADGWFGGLTGAGWVWPYIYAKPLYWMPLPEAPNRVPNV